jgi:hypothetical protein
MGIAYQNTESVSVAAWAGLVGDEEIEHHLGQLAADPEWAKAGCILTDLSGLTEESRPSDERIARAAEVFRSQIGQRARAAKWAMVADATFEEATKFGQELAADAPRLIVFNDQAAACEWLGVDFAQVRRILEELRREAERTRP